MIRLLLILLVIAAGSSASALQFHSKYIAASYFEDHQSLIDSKFSKFLRSEIPLDLHKVLEARNLLSPPTLSLFRRDLIGEGSHRALSSSFSFKLHQELKLELSQRDCKVVVIERLPDGVFADPFELQHLVQRGVFDDAAAFGDTNLELPSFRSNRSVVEVHMNVPSEALSNGDNNLEVGVRVPLHARYPALGVGFSRVEFELPDILMCCGQSCLLVAENRIKGSFNSSAIVWEIPCGNKEHARVISFVTFSVAAASALLIILATVISSASKGSEKPKHS